MKFDHRYQEHIRLSEEVHVRLRLVKPADKERLREGFLNLSGESRQKRFFAGKHGLSDVELRYFTELDHFDHFAIGAVELNGNGEEGDGIGIARFVRLPHDAECAEVAITVIDRMQGRGVGRKLLEKLVDAAVERDIKRFRFECLPHNHEIKKLVEKTCNVVAFVNELDVIVAEVELPGRHLGSHELSVDAFERLFALFRTFATDALDLQVNFGMATVQRSFDMASNNRDLWFGKEQDEPTQGSAN